MPFKDKEKQLESQRKFYAKNKGLYKKHKDNRKKIAAEFIENLKNKPCVDCGNSYPPCVMDFDHLPHKQKKERCVSKLPSRGWSLSRIQEEIEKCDLVCSNCHRIRTYNRIKFGSEALTVMQ